MKLEEYIEMNNFPNVKKLGKIKEITYYIEENISDEDLGVPFVIQEINNKFFVCDSDAALYAIKELGGEKA